MASIGLFSTKALIRPWDLLIIGENNQGCTLADVSPERWEKDWLTNKSPGGRGLNAQIRPVKDNTEIASLFAGRILSASRGGYAADYGNRQLLQKRVKDIF